MPYGMYGNMMGAAQTHSRWNPFSWFGMTEGPYESYTPGAIAQPDIIAQNPGASLTESIQNYQPPPPVAQPYDMRTPNQAPNFGGPSAPGVYPTPMGPTPAGPPAPDITDMMPIQPMPGQPSMTDSMQPDPYPPQMTVPMGPTPMESWMGDYNDETAKMQEAMRIATRNQAFIDQGSALLSAPNWAEGISGMGQASGGLSAGRAQRQQYGMDRENSKLDSLYRMEQIRRSQDPYGGRQPSRPIVLADGRVIKYIEGQPHLVGEGDSLTPISLHELGQMKEEAQDSERKEGEDRKEGKKWDVWYAGLLDAATKGPETEAWYRRQNAEPIKPDAGPGPITPPSQDTKAIADAIREDIRTNPKLKDDPRAAEYLAKTDEELIALYMEERGQ